MSSACPAPSPSTSPTSPSPFQPSHPRPPVRPLTPPSNPYPQPPYPHISPLQFPLPGPPLQPRPFNGLDALVHAANEERRRLSAGTSSESDLPSRPSPVDPSHGLHQFHPPRQDRYKLSDDHARSPRQHLAVPRYSPIQTSLSPGPPMQGSIYSPLLQHRRHVSHEESHLRLSPVDDLHHRSSQAAVLHLPYQPQLPRHQLEQGKHMQQLELQRQRQHHELLLLQEQQQHQLVRERHTYLDRLVQHGPSMPLQLEGTTPQSSNPIIHHDKQNSNPEPLYRPVSAVHPGPVSQPTALLPPPPAPQQPYPGQLVSHSSKKRRYSDSPSRISSEDEEHLHHEREKMAPGDLGFGRLDPAASSLVHKSSSNHNNGRRHLALAELVTSNRERGWLPADETSPMETLHDGRGLPSPVGRRSPPGSQTGRARASRKSDEAHLGTHDQQQPSLEKGWLSEKEDIKSTSPRPIPQTHPATEVPKSRSKHLSPPAHSRLPTSPVKPQDDAHEWFLEHYDECPASQPRQSALYPPPTAVTPIASPIAPVSKSPVPKKKPPAPTTMPEAAVALEQELEELVVTSPIPPNQPTKVENEIDFDMEVDLAVTELVAETLEADDPKLEDVTMEVDVEDELLSLVDDGPLNRRASSHAFPSTKYASSLHPVDNCTSSVPAPSTAAVSPVPRQPLSRSTSDRGSMPPPPPVMATSKGKEKDDKKGESFGSLTATASVTKKSKPEPKSTTKLKTATKPRAKGGSKLKLGASDRITPPATSKSKASSGPGKKPTASRSRSASIMPSGPVGPEASDTRPDKQEHEEASEEDDKLYCICKTKYDEDKFMIACDRCDEWYHTHCVSMPDLEVDLVDQFLCPSCIEKNPHLSLQTTYKTRCLLGLKDVDPSSPRACHRPARGAFSKYCSDECGIKYMQSRVDTWARKGGKTELLWETVKNAEKREGVVVLAQDTRIANVGPIVGCPEEDKDKVVKSKRNRVERDVERLNALLDSVVKLREEVKMGLENVVWREKLLELAIERAEQVGQCGWDQRLCFGEQEWADFGAGVFESYEVANVNNSSEGEGEWWCTGKKMCDRHAGWQTVRYRDVCNEKEKKEDALLNLTTREREIRKRIADILAPHGQGCNDSSAKSPLKSSNMKLNGHAKGRTNGDITKKAKKRKAI